MSNFEMVSIMNEAFRNPKGNPANIDWERIRKQCANIGYEFCELLEGLGVHFSAIDAIRDVLADVSFTGKPDLKKVRDALCDVNVFSYGAHHLMGIDADRDMQSVLNALMSRFIKDPIDQEATIAMHAKKGVYSVYFQGDYPTMIMKSGYDQPDAPKGKFLKSASSQQPVFYTPEQLLAPPAEVKEVKQVLGAFDPLPFEGKGQ
jgi:hypothetical protein